MSFRGICARHYVTSGILLNFNRDHGNAIHERLLSFMKCRPRETSSQWVPREASPYIGIPKDQSFSQSMFEFP